MVFIVERNILEADISFYMIHRNCIRRILNIRRNGHHFQEAVITTVAVLELLGKIDQLLDRIRVYQLGNRLCKIVNIQKEGHKICGA